MPSLRCDLPVDIGFRYTDAAMTMVACGWTVSRLSPYLMDNRLPIEYSLLCPRWQSHSYVIVYGEQILGGTQGTYGSLQPSLAIRRAELLRW